MPMQNRKAGRKESRRGEKKKEEERGKSIAANALAHSSAISTGSVLFLHFSCFPFFLPSCSALAFSPFSPNLH
jgi:hypothetical protein